MLSINMPEARPLLSLLADQAAQGEPFVIAKAGKPMVKVVSLQAPIAHQVRRLGFLAGQIKVPDDFDQMGAEQIMQLFEGTAPEQP